ncbi:molybdopterin-guanine dinucleotide biosynthesis protein A [Marinobacter salarius]|uniref:Molybdopterin-guanine dinucleotide biosynthesis protein A n=1 Tax=Marinobacter salarius TaxID=1420917 RepID=W5YNJ9_9GAMM|nr:molybdopterin-guanine dinucleotide biosynthesis protein A [Marinobacter salarius]
MTECAVILAGGQANRMGGGDKGRLMLGNQSLIQRVIDRITPQVDAVVLNANGDLSRFEDLGLPVVADSIGDFPGPLAGVLAGMDWAAEQGHEWVISVAADTPSFPLDLAARLAGHDTPVALAATPDPERGRLPQPGVAWLSLDHDLATLAQTMPVHGWALLAVAAWLVVGHERKN